MIAPAEMNIEQTEGDSTELEQLTFVVAQARQKEEHNTTLLQLPDANELTEEEGSFTNEIHAIKQVYWVPVNVPTVSWSSNSTVYVLFEDGSIVRGLHGSPEKMDKDRHRLEHPHLWGQWASVKGVYQTVWDNGRSECLGGVSTFVTHCLPPPPHLEGHFQETLSPNVCWFVRFEANGIVLTNLGSAGPADAASTRMGTYAINGHTLTLRFANGSMQHHGICLVGSSFGSIYINNHRLLQPPRTDH